MDIETDLRRWAAWARQDTRLGIKALSIYDSALPVPQRISLLQTLRHQARALQGMNDDEARQFDHALIALKAWKPELFELLKSLYLDGKTQSAAAKVLGIAQQHVSRHLIVAKGFLTGYFVALKAKTYSSTV